MPQAHAHDRAGGEYAVTADERKRIEALQGVVHEMDKKLDLLVERQTTILTHQEDHEDRMRSLEKWKYGIPATLIMAAVAFLSGLIRST